MVELALSLLPGALLALFYEPTLGLLVMLGGVLLLLLLHLRHIDNLVAWARSPIGTPLPQVSGLWDLVFSDLNQRVRAMRDQREHLSLALDRFLEAGQAMPDGVVYLGKGQVIEWANHRAEEHFGLDAKRDVGAPVTNLVRNPEFVAYLDAQAFGEPLLLRPLRQRQLSLLVQVIPYAEDKTMLLSRDVSQLERLETMRRDFVANVSHELRTPLTVVLGFLETLGEGIDDLPREDQLHFIALAREQAERMHRLIQDLLVLSALETGAPPAVEERIEITPLLQAILREAEALSGGRHELVLSIESPDTLLGSAKELHSAFANLVSNAVRYSGAHSRIEMCWTRRTGAGVFSVRDNGIGIDAAHLPRLTERFYRIDRGRSRESGGTGLGLAIVKHVLTRHQGHLEIDSVPGTGSTFSACLPLSRVVSAASGAVA